MNSITKRWVRGSLLITILVMLLAEGIFVYSTINSFYVGAENALGTRISTLLTQISASDAQTEEGRSVVLRRMLEQFAEKDTFELMLVDSKGAIAASTTGVTRADNRMPADIIAAFTGENGFGNGVYRTKTDEKVMAYTAMLQSSAGDVVAIRLVTSLTLLDENILSFIIISAFVALAVIAFSLLSGVYFIRSIVRPIREIEKTAAKIAEGNLDIRIENKYNDEIGKLSDTINHMAGELDKTERIQNEFISSVSHELRTPLTSIKGWIETIADIHDPEDVDFVHGVQVIASETDRLYNMVEELLDFSRMQSGLKLNCELLDLVAEVSDTTLTVGRRVLLEGLALLYDEPELPVPVFADSARLRQVFINIIDNAVKYSPKDGIIKIEILCDDNNAYVMVSDVGQGIAPEDIENVKTKFFKGKGAVRGSGIGLAMVNEIVLAHGGNVSIQSELERGTTITVRLPLYHKNTVEVLPRKDNE